MTTPYDLRVISILLFTQAKRWFAASALLRVCALASGVLGIVPKLTHAAPYGVAVFATLAEFVSWRSDVLKGKAERSLRLLELEDGSGVRAKGEDVADLVLSVGRQGEAPEEEYFSSGSPQGARRLLENLRESAWWTRNLATSMARIVTGATAAIVIASVAFLILSLNEVDDQTSRTAAARVATAVLMVVISLGFVKLTYAYRVLAGRADTASRVARELLQSGNAEVGALQAVHDYQLARATGPLIPDALYRVKREVFRGLWVKVAEDEKRA